MKYKKIIKDVLLFIGYLLFKNKESKVIYYHDVHSEHVFTIMSTSLELFRQHINIIRLNNYKIVNEITERYGQIKICFDDGWKGIYLNRAYFIENDIPVTVFLVSGFVGKEGYLTPGMVSNLKETGIFKFQSHTKTHINLALADKDSLYVELKESKSDLSRLTGKEISELCFPMGYYNDQVVKTAKNVGYTKCYSSIPGSWNNSDFIIKRNLIQGASTHSVKWILHGGQEIFRKSLLIKHVV